MTPAELCLEQAQEQPGHEFETIKNSKSRATTFAKQLRDVGLQAGTRVWHTDNGTRYKVWYKLTREPEVTTSRVPDLMEVLEMSVRLAREERQRMKLEPDLVTIGVSADDELTEAVTESPSATQLQPDLVTADTWQEAADYCRERGWSEKLACNKHDELEVKRRLAMVIGVANVVRL